MLAKSKLNVIKVLIYKSSIDSVIIHDEFVLINNVLKESNEIKEKIKNLKTQGYNEELFLVSSHVVIDYDF